MTEIGIRELKAHASELLRRVKENRERYIVTLRGRPIAIIQPMDTNNVTAEPDGSAWDELTVLGVEIANNWQSPKTSTELLSEMRR